MITEAQASQMRVALEKIRDRAASMPNGGAWAGGLAALCLGTLGPNVSYSAQEQGAYEAVGPALYDQGHRFNTGDGPGLRPRTPHER